MIFDGTVKIIEEFDPLTLSHVQFLLIKDVLETLVISEDRTLGTMQVESPDFKREYHGSQLQVVSRVILFVNLELS